MLTGGDVAELRTLRLMDALSKHWSDRVSSIQVLWNTFAEYTCDRAMNTVAFPRLLPITLKQEPCCSQVVLPQYR
jgi:hypothetical protein